MPLNALIAVFDDTEICCVTCGVYPLNFFGIYGAFSISQFVCTSLLASYFLERPFDNGMRVVNLLLNNIPLKVSAFFRNFTGTDTAIISHKLM